MVTNEVDFELCYFERCYKDTREILSLEETHILNNEGNIPFLISSVEFDRKTLAMLDFLYFNNIIESKKNFYRATLAREWIYNEFEKKEYAIEREEVTTFVYKSMFDGILCGNMERAIHMAGYFGKYKELETKEYLPNVLLGYGLKYAILDEREKAREYIRRLEDNKNKTGMKQYDRGYRRVFSGLIERNSDEFNEGLMFMLKNHRARMKRLGNYLEKYFAYDSIALAMLAKHYRISITVEHELLPMSYLEPLNIYYKEITLFGN